MNKPLPLDLTTTAIPDEVGLIVKMLIEGRLTDLVIVAHTSDGTYIDGIFAGIDGHDSDAYGIIGALEAVKRDWMHAITERPMDQDDEGDE